MQEDNNQAPGAVITPSNNQSSGGIFQPVNKSQNIYETLMLIFGLVTLGSLLINQGFLLKVGATLFLGVAILAIVRSTKNRIIYSHSIMREQVPVKAKRSPLKIVGIIMLVILLAPIILYGGLFVIFLLMLSLGGGDIGT